MAYIGAGGQRFMSSVLAKASMPGGYTRTTYHAPAYGGIVQAMSRAAAQARQANIERQKRIEAIYGKMIGRYQPGGAFERAGLAEIKRARTKGVGQEMQQMISSGLYGTTTAAQVPRRWEEEVGAPARIKLEDIMQQRLTGAQQQLAGFLERIEEPYPDYATLTQLMRG